MENNSLRNWPWYAAIPHRIYCQNLSKLQRKTFPAQQTPAPGYIYFKMALYFFSVLTN